MAAKLFVVVVVVFNKIFIHLESRQVQSHDSHSMR